SAVRRVFDAATVHSRVRRSPAETSVLLQNRRSLAVLELAGPLFFGNVSPIGRTLEEVLAAGARHAVIDVSRIVHVDLSGARRLISVVGRYREQGLKVVLAPIRHGHPLADYLVALGLAPGMCFSDLTEALAAAEATILAEAGIGTPSYATAEDALRALGIPEEHVCTLAALASTRNLMAGESLCRAGDSAEDLFVLMLGEVDVLLPQSPEAGIGKGGERVVLTHLSAGVVIGERALFDVHTRSADVVCTALSRVLVLSGPALAALKREASPAALALVLTITRNTSISLQHANATIGRLEV
ncbi:MAG: cyclic nucleotide-binding domain-containing protein, partial [Pseudomonadota bacterium]|nr:cyclic nucleotide-binding domain-containing protein [Pseudomonadota bacterium]